jgi:hypothetical protein
MRTRKESDCGDDQGKTVDYLVAKCVDSLRDLMD